MITNELAWEQLTWNHKPYSDLFENFNKLDNANLFVIQPRLYNSIQMFLLSDKNFPFTIIKLSDHNIYLSDLEKCIKNIFHPSIINGDYQQLNGKFQWISSTKGIFSSIYSVKFCNWIEMPQLFGNIYQDHNKIYLEPGLLHKVNGGILIIPIKTLLLQPLLWYRLKQMVIQKRFDWLPLNNHHLLPIKIDSMPLNIKVILVGDYYNIEKLMIQDPSLSTNILYSEYELQLNFENKHQLILWMRFIKQIIDDYKVPNLTVDAWLTLITESIRYTEDKFILPLDKIWLLRYLTEATQFKINNMITASSLQKVIKQRQWQYGYLAKYNLDNILQNQIIIQTEGTKIGQINSLTIIKYLNHPYDFGMPSRITCVVHFGDGECLDIERKANLAGNIHIKSMMIIYAYLNYELKLEQIQPFSTSIVFEQSYDEIDGDSASLAEICVLISALSLVPITQQIAVTGSIDQFGYVQPVGGINKKIESFFDICFNRKLTGQQGVIIPTANIRHLSLKNDLILEIKSGNFHIWPVDHVSDAIIKLTKHSYYKIENNSHKYSLLELIKNRITKINHQEKPTFIKFLKSLVLKNKIS